MGKAQSDRDGETQSCGIPCEGERWGGGRRSLEMLEHTHTTVVTRRPTHVRCHMWSLTVRDGGFRTNMLVEACEEDENPCETHAVGDTASLARRHDVPADFSSAMGERRARQQWRRCWNS
jgi:hypothetical protein